MLTDAFISRVGDEFGRRGADIRVVLRRLNVLICAHLKQMNVVFQTKLN